MKLKTDLLFDIGDLLRGQLKLNSLFHCVPSMTSDYRSIIAEIQALFSQLNPVNPQCRNEDNNYML